MSNDMTFCQAIGCPLRSTCARTPVPVGDRIYMFLEVPYDKGTQTCEYHLPKPTGKTKPRRTLRRTT